MGCDIHLFTERRASADAPWELFAVRRVCERCTGSGINPYHADEKCYWCRGTGVDVGYSDRNYRVFSQLADVRNDGDVDPISGPRGLPGDMSETLEDLYSGKLGEDEDSYDEIHAKFGAWPGEHSRSWLTLRDLLDYAASHDVHASWGRCAFWASFVPELAKAGDPEHVRIVFDFDC